MKRAFVLVTTLLLSLALASSVAYAQSKPPVRLTPKKSPPKVATKRSTSKTPSKKSSPRTPPPKSPAPPTRTNTNRGGSANTLKLDPALVQIWGDLNFVSFAQKVTYYAKDNRVFGMDHNTDQEINIFGTEKSSQGGLTLTNHSPTPVSIGWVSYTKQKKHRVNTENCHESFSFGGKMIKTVPMGTTFDESTSESIIQCGAWLGKHISLDPSGSLDLKIDDSGQTPILDINQVQVLLPYPFTINPTAVN